MSDFDIWVDFNSTNKFGRVSTLRRYGPEDLYVGMDIIAGDHDGNLCSAVVLHVDELVVGLKLDMATFTFKEQ